MKTFENLAIFLIGFSYSFLIYNKIAFGITLGLGIIILLLTNLNFVLDRSKNFIVKVKRFDFAIVTFLFLSFTASSFLSIKIERSFAVIIYLVLFIIFSILLYLILKEKKNHLNSILKLLSVSLFINSLIILIYNLINYEGFELIKFKGLMNILSLIAIMNFYFCKSRLNFFSLFFLIPNIYMTGSSAPVLGLISGGFLSLIFYMIRNSLKRNIASFSFLLILVFIISSSSFFFSKQLPQRFDSTSIENFEHKIPINIIDIHRQFIWGFSINKFKDRYLFGYGPDTSNFIEGSQVEIGLENQIYSTGDMNFIPSHPHNFIIELLLETGIIGIILFLLFLIILNIHIFKINRSTKSRVFIVFFNSYFWGSSLVNFSFWLGWWQASFFFILALLAAKISQHDQKELRE